MTSNHALPRFRGDGFDPSDFIYFCNGGGGLAEDHRFLEPLNP